MMDFKVMAGVLCSAALGCIVLAQPSVVALDFRAFYCAGAAVRHHENPYHTGSLRQCELTRTDPQYRARLPGTTLPAPQPLYDIAFFALFAGLPFAGAKALWGALLGAALFIAVLSLVRLTGRSPPLVLGILCVALIGETLALGQIVPLYAAAACSAALFAQRGQPKLAGWAAVASLVEPHLGMPICLALAMSSPKSRTPLALGIGALLVAALAAGGVWTNIEYATKVLPLHALSELPSDGQFSLAAILYGLHVPGAFALKAGTISYFGMSVLGAALARAASVSLRNTGYLVTVPAAAAVVGGSFLHGTDIVAAIPLAFMLTRVPRVRAAAAIALVLLVMPWAAQSNPHDMLPWFLLGAAVSAYVLSALAGMRVRFAAACGAAIFAVVCAVNFAYDRDQHAYSGQVHPAPVFIDERYPQASWARVVAGTFSTQSAPAWAMRVPTWAGLALLCTVTLSASGLRLRTFYASEPVRSQ